MSSKSLNWVIKIHQNQLTGNVVSYRESQNIDVEVLHRAEKPELVWWMATLLCCSEILRIQ